MRGLDDSVIVFDLDDTLYLERDFVRSGFAAVGDWMHERFGVDDFAVRAAAAFETGDRTRIFDQVVADLGLGDQSDLIENLIGIYRSHLPSIGLAPDAAAWLQRHRHVQRIAVLTDGAEITQTNKLRALGLDTGGIAPLICTGQWGRAYWKPHRRGYERIEDHYRVTGPACVYVADNPAKDFIAPRALGWRTVQIVRPGAIHALQVPGGGVHADTVITSLDALDAVLAAPRLVHGQ
jgi:putative hydrolase of the HAD superfamily